MAINALLSTWTVLDEETAHLYWEHDTPPAVKDTVSRAASFLQKNVLSNHYQPWNAFFSGSVKGLTALPFYYPCNRISFTPGEKPHGYGDSMVAVEGIIDEEEYQELIKKGVDGHTVPTDFHGYNNYPDYWPFWSSEPYTYVTNMMALSKYSNTYDPTKYLK